MSDTDVLSRTSAKQKIKRPSKWKVVLHNDDFTPFDFVIAVLMKYCRKSFGEAEAIAVDVHHKGKGIVGSYTKEIGETIVLSISTAAKEYKHPLLSTLEEE